MLKLQIECLRGQTDVYGSGDHPHLQEQKLMLKLQVQR